MRGDENMKRITKVLSALLAALMVFGSMTVVGSAITKYNAAGQLIKENAESTSTTDNDPDYTVMVEKYLAGEIYTTPQEKLASMKMMWESNGYQLWADSDTGEVATVKVSTGEILFTNPWDVSKASFEGTTKKTTAISIKKRLLSQIIVNYTDNDVDKPMESCIEAAMRNQISVEYIKNGIRIEYSIGREETRMLVPKLIEKTRFETKILAQFRDYFNTTDEGKVTISDGTILDANGKKIRKNTDDWPLATVGQTYYYYDLVLMHNPSFDMNGPVDFNAKVPYPDNFNVKKIASYYSPKDASACKTDRERSEMEAAFPITKKMAVYVYDPTASNTETQKNEARIKQYAATYTYEELDRDHEMTEYTGMEKAPALFKMALEYSIDAQGMCVRLPANGIRFDESLYQLKSIEMLPYMGAGRNDGDFTDGGDGYTFFPDGSGTLFDFQQLNTGKNKTITGKVYGQDYAYHNISGTHQEAIRYPAFGIVENWKGNKTFTDYTNIKTPAKYDSDGNLISATEYGTKKQVVEEDHGFLAIIEEGDAMAELSTYHMGGISIYNTVKMTFYPRPQDSYNMSDALSVGSNTELTVVSNRKYVGNYKVRYIMLSDDALAEENNLSKYYECSWLGMAVAYRDYLESSNILNRLTEEDVEDDIPLYIESFGTLMTTEKVASMPVQLMTPLTSFENVKTMYSELSTSIKEAMNKLVESGESNGTTKESASSFSNINFKLTGYANGGMFATMPYNLNWEAAVGGSEGFKDLIEYSKQENFGVFPNFDFVYINKTEVFDGTSMKNDCVKTIDNRYTSRREYSATDQAYNGYFQLAVSPVCYEKYITKFTMNYLKYNPTGIAVSTLGTDLNSDFNEEDPLNREDSKDYTIQAFSQLKQQSNADGNTLKVMTDGANAYAWRYIDYIVNMPLNSSRYNDSSNAVPFIGVVLHGYIQFAGTPINEEGDIQYAFLKAMENGAGLYFTLSYQNTQKLKENMRLSKYFSVRYDIWKDDVVDMYAELNDLLCDLQTKIIMDHEFLIGERNPDMDEAAADAEAQRQKEELEKITAETNAIKAAMKAALELRHTPSKSNSTINNTIDTITEKSITLAKYIAKIDHSYIIECADIIEEANAAKKVAEESKTVVYENKKTISASEKAAYDKLLADLTLGATRATDNIINAAVVNSDEPEEVKQIANAAISKMIGDAVTSGAEYAATYAMMSYRGLTVDDEPNEVFIKTVRSAASSAGTDILASVDEKYAELVSGLVSAMSDGIAETLTSEMAANAVKAATDAYKAAYEADLKTLTADGNKGLVEKYVLMMAKLDEAKKVASNADEIFMRRYNAEYNAKLLDLITKTYKNTFDSNFNKKTTSVYEGGIDGYYKALDTLYKERSDGSDELYKAMITLSEYDKAVAKLDMMKTIAAMQTAAAAQIADQNNRAEADKAIAETVEFTALRQADVDKAKLAVDALDATIRKNAEHKINEEIMPEIEALKLDYTPVYDELVKAVNTLYDSRETILMEFCDYESKPIEMIEAIKLINNKDRQTEIVKFAKQYDDICKTAASKKTYLAEKETLDNLTAEYTAMDKTVKTNAEGTNGMKNADVLEDLNKLEAVKDDATRGVLTTLQTIANTLANYEQYSQQYITYLVNIDKCTADKAYYDEYAAFTAVSGDGKLLTDAQTAYTTAQKNYFDSITAIAKTATDAKKAADANYADPTNLIKLMLDAEKAEAVALNSEAVLAAIREGVKKITVLDDTLYDYVTVTKTANEKATADRKAADEAKAKYEEEKAKNAALDTEAAAVVNKVKADIAAVTDTTEVATDSDDVKALKKAAVNAKALADAKTALDEAVAKYDEYITLSIMNDIWKKDEYSYMLSVEVELVSAKKAAYTAYVTANQLTAKTDTADAIVKLIDAVKKAQTEYDNAKKTYDASAELYNSEFGRTSDEEIDYEKALKALNTAKDALDSANLALDESRKKVVVKDSTGAEKPCEAFEELYQAEIRYLADNEKYNPITSIGTEITNYCSARVRISDEYNEVVEKLSEYAQIDNNRILKAADYLGYVKKVDDALNDIKKQFATSETALNNALATIDKDVKDNLYFRMLDTKLTATANRVALLIVSKTEAEIAEGAASGAANASDYALALEIIGKSTDDIKAAYNAMLEDENATQEQIDKATVLYRCVDVLESNTGKTEHERIKIAEEAVEAANLNETSAQQFYDTAVSETAAAQENFNKLKELYDAQIKNSENINFTEAEVLLASVETFDEKSTAAMNNITKSMKSIETMKAAIAVIIAGRANIEANAKEYSERLAQSNEGKRKLNEALAKYDEALAKGEDASQYAAQIEECRTQNLYYAYRLRLSEMKLNSAYADIKTAYASFQKEYGNVDSARNTAKTALTSIEAIVAYANTLAANETDEALKSRVEAKKNEYNEKADAIRKGIEDITTAIDALIPDAVSLGILVVKDETLPKDQWTYNSTGEKGFSDMLQLINDAYGIDNSVSDKYEVTKYTCNDGTIVAVTYGGKDGDDNAPYRTFLLNYNAFTVKTVYGGVEYELGAYGYKVINY